MYKVLTIIGALASTIWLAAQQPREIQTGTMQSVKVSGMYYKHYDIRLTSSIGVMERFKTVYDILATAKPGDTVVLHLAGYGGRVDATVQMINLILSTKAHVIAEIQGPVYSAHAIIALSAHEIRMAPRSYLMLHHSSALGYSCGKAGKDRGQSSYIKCLAFLHYHLKNLERFFQHMVNKKILTEGELKAILRGYDVYLDSTMLFKRGVKVL